ncbi:uncharacterized protein LOC143433274 [Xylocopa sonorina]|uniref:uncharacterized protein LOC143433274 n=1 Tax=Xylocopa sonorina TaxID=1818115 RepID=UPI00403A920C
MMEGEGVYRSSNGAQYKGEFERNCMHGKGLLEWNSVCWYEGDFANGYPHGRGIMVDGENHYMYTGQWHKGRRHGKGYSRYEDNGSYDGDWTMDKMNGTGLRIYPSGARYVGQWKNGVRHGLGIMVWTNGDVYRGEWKCGAMDGYGVYVWNGFFNGTFTWPQEVTYAGYWRHGMRHGKGDMKLNSVGGARYSGCWKNNKKHGHGIMIGNNGEKLESDSLFLNDIFCASNIVNNTIKNETEVKYEQKCIRMDEEKAPQFVEKPEQLAETLVSPILKPEQFPRLSYHITRLLDPKSLEPVLVTSITSGKCYNCENKSCSCLAPPTLIDTNEQKDLIRRNVSESQIENMAESNWKYEERWIYNCLTLHMSRLRRIYNDYAKLFTKSPPKCNLVMTRLCLWQLWRDCDIHEKGLSLAEIDTYIAKNETALVVDPHHPFERIEIWQFLHALLEVSWHLYTKHNDIEVQKMNGKIAAGLHKFLENDVYPRAGNHVGNLCCENQNLLPAYCVFELYQRIGYPLTAKSLLRSMCAVKSTTPQSSSTSMDFIKNFPDGINSVTIGDKISYLLKSDRIFSSPQYTINVSKEIESDPFNGLLAFKQLGAPKMIKIMAAICPGIKDGNSGVIMNMDYKIGVERNSEGASKTVETYFITSNNIYLELSIYRRFNSVPSDHKSILFITITKLYYSQSIIRYNFSTIQTKKECLKYKRYYEGNSYQKKTKN